jgi:hypothetical protein
VQRTNVYYDIATGDMKGYTRTPNLEGFIRDLDSTEGVLTTLEPGFDPLEYWIDVNAPGGPAFVERDVVQPTYSPSNKIVPADGVSELLITNIPHNTSVAVRTSEGIMTEVVTDGDLEISSDVAQTVKISFYNDRYKRLENEEATFV